MIDANKAELELARKIFWLLQHDHAFLSSYNGDTKKYDDAAYVTINCNDLFVPGADAQELSEENIDRYIKIVAEHGYAGSAAWCSVMRSADLWDEKRTRERNPEWIVKFDAAVIAVKEILENKT